LFIEKALNGNILIRALKYQMSSMKGQSSRAEKGANSSGGLISNERLNKSWELERESLKERGQLRYINGF